MDQSYSWSKNNFARITAVLFGDSSRAKALQSS